MREDVRKAWRDLAVRHFDMAELLRPRFPDGAFFHAYHGFECLTCAWILSLSPGASLPSGHADKIDLLMDLLEDAPVSDTFAALWPDLDRRNESLYVGWRGSSIRTPAELFRAEEVGRILERLRELLDTTPAGPA